jgi:hypothetical protein
MSPIVPRPFAPLLSRLNNNTFDPITANIAQIRKKYRKMRMKFDEKMRESNQLVVAEALAEETAKRLAIENEFVALV